LPIADASPAVQLQILRRADAFRRADRFAQLLEVALYAEPGIVIEKSTARLQRALAAANTVDAGAIAREVQAPAEIASRLERAREQAIAAARGD